MKYNVLLIVIFYSVFSVSGSLYAVGEKTVRFDGRMIGNMANVRTGVAELVQVRPVPVLALASSGRTVTTYDHTGRRAESFLDLSLSFDERHPSLFRDSAGRYRITVSPALASVDRRLARAGYGAALFPGASLAASLAGINAAASAAGQAGNPVPLRIEAQSPAALFAPNKRFGDFSLEFWLHPLNMENGEQILYWVSSPPVRNLNGNQAASGTHNNFQRILCVSSRNRLHWSFQNFFISPDGRESVDISFSGISAVVPKTWSHHLIRFDSATGMVEYLVNGRAEAIEYATSTRRESGEVFTPLTGEGGSFVLGGNYMGMMDEFKIHGSFVSDSPVRKYSARGGRIETRAIDLGEGNNEILNIEVSGGRTRVINHRVNSEHRRNGRFLFSDDSEMQFFIRTSDNPHRWDNPWRAVTPGAGLDGSVNGRYVQLAVDFYPSADGETSPYLEEIKITFLPEIPPLPPSGLTAVAMDGAVRLTWRSSPNALGYFVYYGSADDGAFGDGIFGPFFGVDSTLGPSPIDAGQTNSITITGLKNGTLYHFRVAAYGSRNQNAALSHAGEFSREVRARPLRGLN